MVKSWPRPFHTTNIQSFLGLVGYYRRFVERLLSIASPSTTLTQKKSMLDLSKYCKEIFTLLKDKLISASVMTSLEGTEGFVVYFDAFRVGLGCVLMKHDKVITYVSTGEELSNT